jgi:hypothetical protein
LDLFGALLLASCKNRAFWCFPFETNVLFGALPHAKIVLEIVLFGVLLHATNCAFWIFLVRSSCMVQESCCLVLSFVKQLCFSVLSLVPKTVLEIMLF